MGKSISTATAEAVREVVEGLRGRAKASANGSGKAHQPAPKPQFPAGITAVCPHCGDEPSTYTKAEAGWECGSCFKPVLIGVLPAEPRACPHCGSVVTAADTNFCDNCGQALE